MNITTNIQLYSLHFTAASDSVHQSSKVVYIFMLLNTAKSYLIYIKAKHVSIVSRYNKIR